MAARNAKVKVKSQSYPEHLPFYTLKKMKKYVTHKLYTTNLTGRQSEICPLT